MIYDEFHAAFSARNIVKGRILHDINAGILDVPNREWKFARFETAHGSSPRIFVMNALIDAVIAEFGGRISSSPSALDRISELAAKNQAAAWLLPSVAVENRKILPWGYEMEASWVRNGRPAISASTGLLFLRNRFLETIIPVPACFLKPDTGESVMMNNVVENMLTGQDIPCAGDVDVRGQWMKRLYVIPADTIRWSSRLWYSEQDVMVASKAGVGFLKAMTAAEVEDDARNAATDCAGFIDPDLFVDVRRAGVHKRAMMNLVARDAMAAAKQIIASDLFAKAASAINLLGSHLPAEDWPTPDFLGDVAISDRAIQGLMWLCVDSGPADTGSVYAPDCPDDRLVIMLAIMTLVETGACPRYVTLNIGQSTGQHWPAILTALAAHKHGSLPRSGEASVSEWHQFASWVPDVDRANLHLDNVQRWYQREADAYGEHQGPEVMTS